MVKAAELKVVMLKVVMMEMVMMEGQDGARRGNAVRHRSGRGSRMWGLLWAGALCTLLPGAGRALEFGGESTYFDVGGSLSTGNALRMAGAEDLRIGLSTYEQKAVVAQINKARLGIYGTYPGGVSSQLTLDLEHTSEPARAFSDRGEVRLDEAYVDFRLAELDFRVGLQKIVWGKADLVSPFDILTARDLRDPFVFPTLEDRIAQAGIRVNYYFGDYSLEGFLSPVWIRSQVPQAETDADGDTRMDEWFPPMAIYPTEGAYLEPNEMGLDWFIFMATYDEMEKPDNDLSTASFGTKMNMLKGDYDIDFYLLSTMDPMPTAEVRTVMATGTIDGLPGQGLVISIDGHMLFRRVTVFGAAAARTFGPVALRSEVAFQGGKQYFRLFDPEDSEEAFAEMLYYGVGEVRGKPKSHAALTWITGVDYEIPNLRILTSNQLIFTTRFSHEDYYTQGALDVNWSFHFSKGFQDDHLSTGLTGMAQFASGSIWLGPSVTYTLPSYEDLQLGLKMNIFGGEEFSTVGMYSGQSNLLFTVKWWY